jgi:hypothetical protein
VLAYTHDTQLEFSLGDFSIRTTFAGGVTLAPNEQQGEYRSAWLPAPSNVQSGTIRWNPGAPYGKPLPAVTNASETTLYAAGSSMEQAVLLLRLNGTVGSGVTDQAGLPVALGGHPVNVVDLDTPGDSAYVPGVFGTGLHLQRSDYLVLGDADTHPDFAYGTNGFTWSLWVRMVSCDLSQDNAVAMGGEDPHIWIGAVCPSGVAHFQVEGEQVNGPNIMDGTWHHLAASVSGSTPLIMALYLDGVQVDTGPFTLGSLSNFTKKIFLGNFPIGTAPRFNYATDLDVDEVAIFKRGLGPAEIRALALRGQRSAMLQVRACDGDIPGCLSRPFLGPGGQETSFFSDANNTLVQLPQEQVIPPGALGPLVQYRILLSAPQAVGAPVIPLVTVRLSR